MNISLVILVAVLHVFMASAEPLPTRSAHTMTVVQRRRGYQGSDQITSEEYRSSENNQDEDEDDWNESKEHYFEHESKDSSDVKSLEAKHSNETNNDNKNDENVSNHKHHSHEIGHLVENIEKPYNYTKQMEASLDLADPREISEILYEITGFKDETMVIAYCKTTAGLKSDEEAYDFLMSCGGARGIKFVIRLLKKLAGSSNIKVIAQLVKILTDEECVTPGFKIIQRLTGHNDIDGVIEVLQRISGRNSISDLIDFFEHNENHTTGLDGISHQIYKLTGGVGPKEFPAVFEALKSEVDWTATFNILITVMRCNDISESIVELKKIVGAKTFPEAIDVMKLTTEQTHFRYALEAFLEETGRVNLKIVIETLYRLSGKSDLMSVLRELQRLYKINNIIRVFQTVNKISKKRDPLVVLSNLLDLTGAANLSDCSAVFTGLTFRQMTALEVLDQIQVETGYTDLVEFLRGMLTVTGSRTLLKSWQIIVTVTQKNDIFVLINSLKQYTSVDLITVFQFLQRITNTINIVPATEKIYELLEIKGFFEWFEVLHHVVEIDVIVFLESFTSLSSRSMLEDAIDITMHYTNIYEPIQAIIDLREATQQEDIFKAIEYVKSKKSRHNNATTATTTLTPSTSQESTTETTSESTPEPTTEQHPPDTESKSTTEQSTETATENTPQQTQEAPTEAIKETSTDALPETTAKPSTEPVSEATTESKPDLSTTPTPENTVEPTTEQTPVPTSEATTESKPESTTTPTPESTVEPSTEQTPVPKTEATTELTPESTTTPAPEVTVEPSTEKTPVPTTEATTEGDKSQIANVHVIAIDENQSTPANSSESSNNLQNKPVGQEPDLVTIQQSPENTLINKETPANQETTLAPVPTDIATQPTSNDQKDLNDKPNPSNPHDTKNNPEKEAPVTSGPQSPIDLDTNENPNNKGNETDSQPAVPGDQSDTVKKVTIIVQTSTVAEETPNQEKPVEKPSELTPSDSSKDGNVSNDKPKEENIPTPAPEPTSNPTEVPPSETTEKPNENTTPSDEPKETSTPDNNPKTEVSTEHPLTEATPPSSVTSVDQTTPNETTEKPAQETSQGPTPGTENQPCTQETPSDIKTTDKESPASDKPVENSSPTNDKPNDNPSSTQPREPKPDGPTEVESTSTSTTANTTTQPEQIPVSGPGSTDVKPDPQALQVNMNLKLLILPKGPKNTKNCYCACESQEPPKLIPTKQLPVGITNNN